MSWQMAIMAGVSALQTGISAARGASAAAASGEAGVMGAKVRASQYEASAAEIDVLSEETGFKTAQQELNRRRELARLGQANAADYIARGGMATGQDSAAAIDRYNAGLAEEDVHTIRMMGESQQRQLSFRKRNLEFAAEGQHAGAMLTGAATSRSIQDQLLNAGFKLAGVGLSLGGGSKTSGFTTNEDMLRTDRDIKEWSSYG